MTDWLTSAACHGMDGTNGRIDFLEDLNSKQQQAICARCSARFDCLEEALDSESDKDLRLIEVDWVRGALTGKQRAELQRKRRGRVA